MAPLEKNRVPPGIREPKAGDVSLDARKSLTRESCKAFFTVVCFCFKFDASTSSVKPPKSNPTNILPAVLEVFLAYRHGKDNRHIFTMQLFVANAQKMDFQRLQRALKT
jgi:hypothetical protein